MRYWLLSGIIGVFFCVALPFGKRARAEVPLDGHRGAVTAVAVSPDGRFIVTGGKDRVLILRDGTTGKETKRLEGHKEPIGTIVFEASSNRFASLGGKSVLMWRVGDTKPDPPLEHPVSVTAMAFSPDGGQLVTGLRGVAAQWNLGDTTIPPRLCPFPGGAITAITFFAGGNFFTTTGSDAAVRFWSSDGQLVYLLDSKHRSGIISVDLSSDGKRIITGGKDKTAAVWDVKSQGQDRVIEEKTRFSLHRNDVTFVAFGSDPQTVISASLDKTLQQWDTNEVDGKAPKVWFKKDLAAAATAGATNSQRDRLVILTSDGKATLYTATELGLLVAADTAQKSPSPFLNLPAEKLIHRWDEAVSEPHFVAFNKQGRFAVALANGGGEIRDPNADAQSSGVKFGDKRPMTTVTFNGNGSVVVAGRDDGTIIGYDAGTGKELRKFSGHALPVRAACFSPNGERIVTGSDDTKIHLWNATNGNILGTFSGHTGPVRSVAVSPDQSMLASGSDDTEVRLWTTDKFQTLHAIDKHSGAVLAVAFSPDGKHIASGSRDKGVIVTKCEDATQVKRIRFGDAVTSLAFTPDGAWLVAGSLDGTAVIIDAASWEPKRVCLPRALPDPKYDTIKIRGKPPQPPLLPVTSIAISPDGKQLVTAGGGTTQLWSLTPKTR